MSSNRPRRGRTGFGLSLLIVAGAVAALGPAVGAPRASATALPSTVEAWIYPASLGQPACDTPAELSALAASPVAILKPEYLAVSGTGRVRTETSAQLPCNGFSTANLAEVRAAAHRVYVTVSAGNRATDSLVPSPAKRAVALSAIEGFVGSNGLDGVDLDFEPNRWTTTTWSGYLTFVSSLVQALAPAGRSVEVDAVAFTSTPWDAERYGDLASAGAHLVVMAYDHEFDLACAPISPIGWLQKVVAYAQSQVPVSDLTIGLPSYGYTTPLCRRVAHVTSNVAFVTMESEPGFPTTAAAVQADRDPSSDELRWSAGGIFHDVVDATALDAKLQAVESMGISDVSVWSLGGEPWFSGNPG